MIKVGDVVIVKISGEPVYVLEDVKYVTKYQALPLPEGAVNTAPTYANVKVPVDTQTFKVRCRYNGGGGTYSTYDFTAGELEPLQNA